MIPQDGSPPVPAFTQNSSPSQDNLAPAFPSQASQVAPQVARQIPVAAPFAAKSVQFFPRSKSQFPEITFHPDPTTGENIGQIRGGFKLVVSGIQVAQADGSLVDYGSVSLEADNAVVWIRSDGNAQNLFEGFTSTPDRPIELYMDGNIVFNQGNRVIYADRMYYNVSSEYGMVLSAEVLTPVPQYQGLLRLKADVLKQFDRQNFMAYGAAVTSSRLGVPRYWLQANEVQLQDTRTESDLSVFAPADATRDTNMQITSRSNYIYLGGVPIMYWPTFATNLSDPSFYLTSAKFKNDTIFGTQIYAEWDVFQLLGMRAPEGTRLRLSTD